MADQDAYFDNAAAAVPERETLDFLTATALTCYPNQEAVHGQGYRVRKQLDSAGNKLAIALTGDASALTVWGGSGTELFNLLALAPLLRQGNVVATLEHPALLAALQRSGAELRRAPLLGNGQVDLEALGRLVDRNTALVTVHHVQSETGVAQDLTAVRRMLVAAPQAIFFSDTIQSAGKLPLPWAEAGLDLIAVSGHKLGVPGGAAFILRAGKDAAHRGLAEFFTRSRAGGYLSGRPDPAIMLTLAHVAQNCVARRALLLEKIIALNLKLRERLCQLELAEKQKIRFTVPAASASPFILHMTLPGYEGAALVRMLAAAGVTVAAGSACSAESKLPSPALTAMNYSKKDAFSALRVSFWRNNSEADVRRLAEALEAVIKTY